MFRILKNILFLGVVWLAALPLTVYAQDATGYSWEMFVEEYLQEADEAAEDAENAVERQEWLEELESIHRSRININMADREDLMALHFLSDVQVDSILAKRDRRRGGFRSLGELMTVCQLSYRDRAWLSLLLEFGEKPEDGQRPEGLWRKEESEQRKTQPQKPSKGGRPLIDGKYEILATMDLPLYQRAGFYDYDEDNYATKMFTGYNFGHTLRLRYNWQQRVMYGATVQEDVGERFGQLGGHPWDYQSVYAYYRTPTRPSQGRSTSFSRFAVMAGDYRLALGQGLLMGSSGWGGASSLMGGVRTEPVRLRPHSSTDESRFLRGVAATLRLGRSGRWSMTAFGSWRKLDGTVADAPKDNSYKPTPDDVITAWKTDGLHRTLQEVGKRGVATQSLGGGRVGYAIRSANVGISGVWMHYDKVYNPVERTYNKYYMRGRDASGLSADYTLRFRRWSLQGEAAVNRGGAYASTVALRLMPSRGWNLVLQERSFSRRFVSPWGRSFQAGSQLQNEHGLLLGARYRGWRRLDLTAYADVAHHPAPVYLADTASWRAEGTVQALWRPSPHWQCSVRYRIKARQQNVSGYKDIPDYDEVLLAWRATQHVRLQTTWMRGPWNVALGGDGACFHSQAMAYDKKHDVLTGTGLTYGGLLFARSTLNLKKWLKTSAMLAAFHTADYNTRCYAYVPQLRGGVGSTGYYGRGFAGGLAAECRLWSGLYAGARIATVHYADRESIGTGVQAIEGGWKSDLKLQLRWTM